MAEVTIQGVRSLARKLRDMPGPVRDNTRQAIENAARDITATMQSLVPKGRTRRLLGSIGWTWGKIPRSTFAIATAKDISGNTLTIFAGNPEAFYARWVEFGTRPHSLSKGSRLGKKQGKGQQHAGNPAQPFFFPAYRAHKKDAKRQINAAIRKAIKQVAASGGANV